ncbi:MAG: acyl-CoA thioesterase [Candidatus Thermoplasmatota archaeon]|jgi:acyl-CoA thioester hydrolase|nr:acyl-CoA thioesterase [Candidatus Thermoplasmatota archaeon]
MKNSIRLQIRYGDLDTLGHVNNAVFLTYFELGRIEFLKMVSEKFDAAKVGIVIAHAEIDYKRPLLIQDDPVLETEVERIGNKSITFLSTIREKSGEICAQGLIIAVCIDESGNTIKVPESWKKVFLS